ncbi:MAG: ABC transporter ATP-binding protein [Pseudomonadota bacterium]
MRLLKETLPPRFRLYGLSIICMIGVAAMTGALAWSTKLVVNDVFSAGDASAAVDVALILMGIAVVKAGVDYANAMIQVIFKRSVQADYQKRIFADFVRKDVWFFLGEHQARYINQVKMFSNAASRLVVNLSNKFITDVLTLTALVIVMILQDPLMSLVLLVLFPLIFALVSGLSARIRSVAKDEVAMTGAVDAVASEAFQGIRTLKTYQLEEKSISKYHSAVDAVQERIFKIARLTSATMPLMQFLGGLILGGFVLYASWQTISYGRTPGEFTAFITAFLLAYQPAERVSKLWVDVQKSLVAAQQMYIALERPARRALGGVETLDDAAPSVEFKDVSFSYDDDSPALHGVSFQIAPGERIAIVGRSGSGKTTTIDLVQRFYDPTEGQVRIGGYDLREVSEASVRRYIALISQDVFLFEGTIRENIRDGRPDAFDTEIARAAHLAALDDALASMPDGLDTEVGPNGSNLSGGQRQRVGIARALLSDARIYILDEATSALDARNDLAVLENIRTHIRDATVMFVTHRSSTLGFVDRVIMLDAGQVVGFDTFARLAEEHNEFRTLFTIDEQEAGAEASEPEDERQYM